MLGRWSESVISGWGWCEQTHAHTDRQTHTHTFHISDLRMMLSASDMMMSASQAAFICLLKQTSSAFSHFVLSLFCLGRLCVAPPPKWRRAAIVWRGAQTNRHSTALLARLTLLIAQSKKRQEAIDGVRPRGEKVVKVKFYEICLHLVLREEVNEFICIPVSRFWSDFQM